jgi:hypothetical protein
MSAAPRDQEALDLAAARTFAGAFVVSFALDMQARRLALRVYGALRADSAETVVATLTFFGTNAIALDNAASAFPQSAELETIALAYDDANDEGTVELRGRRPWSLRWRFDGFAYEESPAVLASLVDDV